ncbi:hypothetical protein E4U17_005451 [Claviceps sp. LM77 group G4]|nr:hypothetical protein E4U17_005451 [Claviceps sp. LM77 group G4]KAG6075797.1 hypothetical protein E4U16_003153 [Claviceps sp. LM84 group G4]KAG6081373.1 hypothetical protein E4U33_006867 [Claviceps sp. LM78 group G4]
MRFAVAVVSGLAAVVSAQTPVSADPATASSAACLKKCAVGDVNCQSHCITVPSPNEQQVNDTTKCAAACPQGSGSPEETQKYADCVQGCISKHYFDKSGGTPQPTGGNSGSSSGSGSGSSSSGSSSGAGASDSDAHATATQTGAAAPSSSADSGSNSGSGSDSGSSSSSGSGDKTSTDSGDKTSGSKTSSSPAATSTNAAPGLTFGASGALVGALAAIFAL